MPMLLCRLAIMASIILATTSCQTTSSPSPKDGPELITQAVAEAKEVWCNGQMPQPYTDKEYDALSEWAQKYVIANQRQWQKGCAA